MNETGSGPFPFKQQWWPEPWRQQGTELALDIIRVFHAALNERRESPEAQAGLQE